LKILLTGLTGYIGKRLLPVLLEEGHEVVSIVRDKSRVPDELLHLKNHTVQEGDLLEPEKLAALPADLDIAFYLVHSMGATRKGFRSRTGDLLTARDNTGFSTGLHYTLLHYITNIMYSCFSYILHLISVLLANFLAILNEY